MLKIKDVLHFTIPVKDLDRAEQFYCGLLGMERIRRTGHMLFLRCNQTSFVCTLSENHIAPNRGDRHEIHTAFTMMPEEYDRAKIELAERGIAIFKEEPARTTGTFHGRSAYFHDPDRNVIEIIDLVRGPVSELESR